MIGRIVDISSDGIHLSVDRGFMSVSKDREQQGRIALDDISALIVHAHGTTFSANLVTRLAERNAPIVMCAANHAPVALVWPVDGHFEQGARMRAQADAGKPLRNRLWRDLIKAKIRAQGNVLDAVGQPSGFTQQLSRKVRSGDPDNIEATAARRYWRLMMGKEFRRERTQGGVNACLNYGYMVLRAATARSILGAGLHPSLSLHHISRGDALCLADDLMEPFRPFVDLVVRRMNPEPDAGLDRESKAALAGVIQFDLGGPKGASPIHTCMDRLATSLAQLFMGKTKNLELPGPPLPLDAASP